MLGNILDLIHEETSQGKKGVLCTLVDATGSSPRHLGARMWVRPDGSTAGTIGGGTVEFRVQERAKTMLLQHENPVLHRESMWNDEVSEGEPACGGEVGIFLEILGQDRELVLFGAGHVGLAVARLGHFAGFAVTVWDERPEFASSERFPGGASPLRGKLCGHRHPRARTGHRCGKGPRRPPCGVHRYDRFEEENCHSARGAPSRRGIPRAFEPPISAHRAAHRRGDPRRDCHFGPF